MGTRIQPRNDYVLIERLPEPSTKGSILIPDIAKETGTKGKILAVGPGKRDEDGILQPLEVKPGDMVYFNSKWSDLSETHYHADSPVHFDSRLHLVQEGDIVGRINHTPESTHRK